MNFNRIVPCLIYRLSETVRKIFTDLLKSARMQLGNCVMPTRCISPNEMVGIGHTFYFDASEINVAEKCKNPFHYMPFCSFVFSF